MTKRERLEQILAALKAGEIPEKELKLLHILGTDGKHVALTADDAIAALEARIAELPQ